MTAPHTVAGHTAGPWYLSADSWAVGTKHSADPSVCVVVSARRHFAEVGANARLITAAPDLLEALLIVQRNMQRGVTGAEARKGWDKARAAIAKATAARQSNDMEGEGRGNG